MSPVFLQKEICPGNDVADQLKGAEIFISEMKGSVYCSPRVALGGDSGGPIFINQDGKEKLYAIIVNEAVAAPIVDHRDWLLKTLKEFGCW